MKKWWSSSKLLAGMNHNNFSWFFHVIIPLSVQRTKLSSWISQIWISHCFAFPHNSRRWRCWMAKNGTVEEIMIFRPYRKENFHSAGCFFFAVCRKLLYFIHYENEKSLNFFLGKTLSHLCSVLLFSLWNVYFSLKNFMTFKRFSILFSEHLKNLSFHSSFSFVPLRQRIIKEEKSWQRRVLMWRRWRLGLV